MTLTATVPVFAIEYAIKAKNILDKKTLITSKSAFGIAAPML